MDFCNLAHYDSVGYIIGNLKNAKGDKIVVVLRKFKYDELF